MMDVIRYPDLIDSAMRGVVREVLRLVAKHGLPGEHHFYISFRTDHPAVRVSDALHARYPQEMTVVLQHQFWDFSVEENQFMVTLSFGGVPEKLVIPFSAMTAFADPSVKFGLQFQSPISDTPKELTAPSGVYENDASAEAEALSGGAAEIISLDAFRKK